MFTDLARQFNWLDVVYLILLIRVCYVAQERGSLVEIFKVLGLLIGILLSFENFNFLGEFIRNQLSIPPELINAVCFVALLIFGYFISMVFRDLILKFIKRKDKPAPLDKLAALVLGAFRASLIFSLVLLTLRLSGPENMRNDVKRSYLAPYFLELSSKTHLFIFNVIIKKIKPDFQANPTIQETLK